jgi:hypothetical protein
MTIVQKVSETYKERLINFQKCLVKLRKQHEYLLGQTGIADQAHVFFDKRESTTVNSTGKQMLQI